MEDPNINKTEEEVKLEFTNIEIDKLKQVAGYLYYPIVDMPYKLTLLEEENRKLREEIEYLKESLNRLTSDFEVSRVNEECKIANFVNEMSYRYVTDYINT